MCADNRIPSNEYPRVETSEGQLDLFSRGDRIFSRDIDRAQIFVQTLLNHLKMKSQCRRGTQKNRDLAEGSRYRSFGWHRYEGKQRLRQTQSLLQTPQNGLRNGAEGVEDEEGGGRGGKQWWSSFEEEEEEEGEEGRRREGREVLQGDEAR